MGCGLHCFGERGFIVDFWTSGRACWRQRSDVWSLFLPDYRGDPGTSPDSGRDRDFGRSDLWRHDIGWSCSAVAVRYFLGRAPLWLDGRWFGRILVLKTQAREIGKSWLNLFMKETVNLLLEY